MYNNFWNWKKLKNRLPIVSNTIYLWINLIKHRNDLYRETVKCHLNKKLKDPHTWKTGERSQIQAQPGLQGQFKASLGYRRPCLKKDKLCQHSNQSILAHKLNVVFHLFSFGLDLKIDFVSEQLQSHNWEQKTWSPIKQSTSHLNRCQGMGPSAEATGYCVHSSLLWSGPLRCKFIKLCCLPAYSIPCTQSLHWSDALFDLHGYQAGTWRTDIQRQTLTHIKWNRSQTMALSFCRPQDEVQKWNTWCAHEATRLPTTKK